MPDTEYDGYIATVDRLEPKIYPIDSAAGWSSIAISLKRIADYLDHHAINGQCPKCGYHVHFPNPTHVVTDENK